MIIKGFSCDILNNIKWFHVLASIISSGSKSQVTGSQSNTYGNTTSKGTSSQQPTTKTREHNPLSDKIANMFPILRMTQVQVQNTIQSNQK